MKVETITEEVIDKKHYVQRINSGDAQIAEIYFTETNSLDFVVMYFDYNLNNSSEIENRITEYRKNGGNCIIGCFKNTEGSEINTLFDIYLDSASDCDFENLIEFCISTENAFVHISQHDFKSKSGTKVLVVSEKEQSVEKLVESLRNSIQKQMVQSVIKKFPKVVCSFMTNDRSLQLSEVETIIKSTGKCLAEDSQCMLNLCELMEGLVENEIKVTMIFFENRTMPVCRHCR